REHRDFAGQGCVAAALGSEIARQPKRVRDAFTTELKEALKFLAEVMPGSDSSASYDDAIAAFVSMAGALMLARAVSDKAVADHILNSTAQLIIDRNRHQPSARHLQGT